MGVVSLLRGQLLKNQFESALRGGKAAARLKVPFTTAVVVESQ
jgi:hypothetical protein